MEKLEILKQKLSKRRKLAVGCLLGGAAIGVGVKQVVQNIAYDVLKETVFVRNQALWEPEVKLVIIGMAPHYLHKYGVKIPYAEPETYLNYIEANKAAFGDNYNLVYSAYQTAFRNAENNFLSTFDVLENSQSIGIGAGIASFLLVAGIPTAKYLLCKRKIKKLEKELNENKEVEMTA